MITWKEYIVSNPEILFGKPLVVNTRISVDLVLEKLADGYQIDDLLDAYPKLTKESIYACLLYAAESVKNEVIYLKAS